MNIGVLGCGNMASALIKGIWSKNQGITFHTYTPSFTRAHALAEDVNGIAYKNHNDMPEQDFWVIACKPQQLQQLAMDLNGKLKDQKVISLLAAVNLAKLQKELHTQKVLRVMPNTPSRISQGISLFIAAVDFLDDDIAKIKQLFAACSKVFMMDSESQFDAITTISGSGPAYVFYFIQKYIEQAIALGMNTERAKEMVCALFAGATQLVSESSDELSVMIDQVTSKGGVTIEAINVLDNSDIGVTIEQSLHAATKRSKEMTQLYS